MWDPPGPGMELVLPAMWPWVYKNTLLWNSLGDTHTHTHTHTPRSRITGSYNFFFPLKFFFKILHWTTVDLGFPGGSVVKNLPANAGDTGSIPGSGWSPGEENGNSLQSSCLGNPMDREAWWSIVHEVTKSLIPLNDLNNNNSWFTMLC